MSGENEIHYYQFQGMGEYPFLLKFEGDEIVSCLKNELSVLGFKKIETKDAKKLPIQKFSAKILKISMATPKVAREITMGAPGLELMGPESISARGSYNVYKYKSVGMMVFANTSSVWELGVLNPEAYKKEIKIILIRFLSWALATQGILGLWGVPVEEGIVVMKPITANHEVVFLDLKKMRMMTQDGSSPIYPGTQIIRLDEGLKQSARQMSKEQLVSFLSTHTTYLSHQGLHLNLREAIIELSSIFDGIILPTENFKPRAGYEA